jgi:hypothetical protein
MSVSPSNTVYLIQRRNAAAVVQQLQKAAQQQTACALFILSFDVQSTNFQWATTAS